MTVTVYEKNHCVACNQTKKTLDRKGVTYDKINVEDDQAAYDYITKNLGHMAAPVVVVRDETGSVVNNWSGFNLDKLNSLVA
jgi:glutaredoxin-like protein NrdH